MAAEKSADKVHVRKRKDEVWRVRELITVPNWSVLRLLYDGAPRTNSQIYSALGKSLTRKTLILSIRKLSTELGILEPQHTQGGTGFELSYALSPQTRELMKELARFDKYVAKKAEERKAANAKLAVLRQAAQKQEPLA